MGGGVDFLTYEFWENLNISSITQMNSAFLIFSAYVLDTSVPSFVKVKRNT